MKHGHKTKWDGARALLLATVLCGCDASPSPDPEPRSVFRQNIPFSIQPSAALTVFWRGRPLLISDELAGVERMEDGTELREDETASVRAINLIRTDGRNPVFRRETVLRADGSLELTVKAKYASYAKPSRCLYAFRLPLDTFGSEVKFRALVGRAHSAREVEGVLSPLADNAASISGEGNDALVRYLALSGPNGSLILDFNPYGATQMYTDYPFSGEPMGASLVGVEDGVLLIRCFSRDTGLTGGLFAQKIVVAEGGWDFDRRHPYTRWSYRGGPDPVLAVRFDGPSCEPYRNGSKIAYSKDRGWGWESDRGGTNAASAIFRADLPPGRYVLTLTRDPRAGVKPESRRLEINGVPTDLPPEENPPGHVLAAARLDPRPDAPGERVPMRLRFSGPTPWVPLALTIQVLTYTGEDFDSRPLWHVPGLFEPDFNLSADFPMPDGPPIPRANGESDWRQTMRMGNWCPGGHAATGFEYDTPELVERRTQDMKTEGIDTIQQGALFFNLGFTDRWDDAIRMIRAIADSAHRRGMAAVHHADGPVIVNMRDGHNYLLRHLDGLQRDIRYGFPSFSGMCLNHPAFRADLYGRLARLARQTGIDGLMLDECTFFSKDLCGCRYCREKFTRDTGLVLPDDPNSPVWFNMNDRLWVSWLQWRKRCVGEWKADLLKLLQRDNPRMVLMAYTTHYGISDRWASLEFGAGLFESLDGINFPGTEIMPRNVFDSWRSVFAFRKLFSAAGDSVGHPAWGLVYHSNDPSFAYAGWAMNQMNRQSTWMNLIEGANLSRFLDWPDRMNLETAQPIAELGIVFSSATRDFARGFAYAPDLIGLSEQLTDRHVLHDFILERNLTADKLSRYRVIFAPSLQCLSAEQAQLLRDYVAHGGILFSTGNISTQDELGIPLPDFRLRDLLGVSWTGRNVPPGAVAQWRDDAEPAPVAIPVASAEVAIAEKDAVAPVVFANPDSPAARPALVRHPFGQGVSIYSAIRFGAALYEPEPPRTSIWETARNPELESFFDRALRLAESDIPLFRAVKIPARMPVNAYRQDGVVLVHLLNLTGAADLKPGDRVPTAKPGNAFPDLPDDVVFDVRFPVASAFVSSPDYDGRRPVALERMSNGTTRVTVRKSDARTYSIVRLLPDPELPR